MKFITSSMKSITPEMLSQSIIGANLSSQPHKKREENYLYVDLGKYAKEAWETLLQSDKAKDETEKELILFNGFNQTMKTMLDENGYYLFYFDVTPGNNQVKYDEYCDFRDLWDIKTIISLIFQVNNRRKNVLWSEKTSLECNKSAVAFYLLWLQLEKEVERAEHRLKLVEHCPSTPIVSIEDILDDCAAWNKEQQQQTPHFNVDLPDEVLIAILNGLKQVKWKNNRVMDIGIVGDDITEEEWLYILKGVTRGCFTMTRKLPWKSVQACKSFVEQLLGKNYQLAEEIFCWSDKKGMHEIKNLRLIKNDRRDDICDEKTGIIAVIIQNAMRLMDKKTA